MHQEAGTLENHPHGLKIVKGHAEKQQVDTSLIKKRHDELVEEMERRGFNHDSLLEYVDELDLGSIDTEQNIKDLSNRCDKCLKRIQNKR